MTDGDSDWEPVSELLLENEVDALGELPSEVVGEADTGLGDMDGVLDTLPDKESDTLGLTDGDRDCDCEPVGE